NVRQFSSIKQNFSGPGLVETTNQLSQRRLSASGCTHQRHPGARRDSKGKIGQQRRLPRRKAETQPLEPASAGKLPGTFSAGRTAGGWVVEGIFVDILEPLESSLDGLQAAEIVHDIGERLREACRQRLERHQAAERERALDDPQASEAQYRRDRQPRQQRRN